MLMCLALARSRTYTPVDNWMRMPILNLIDWVVLVDSTNKKK